MHEQNPKSTEARAQAAKKRTEKTTQRILISRIGLFLWWKIF